MLARESMFSCSAEFIIAIKKVVYSSGSSLSRLLKNKNKKEKKSA